MFFIFAIVIAAVLALAAVTGGPSHAMRVGWLSMLFVPTWMSRDVGAMTLNLRMVAVVMMVPIAIFGGRLVRRLNLVDAIMVLFLGIGITSLFHSDSASPTEVAAILGTLLLPYFFGRILIGSLADLRALVPWTCAACIVLS
ncbi:MAG: hypothetical protein WBD31_25240, partial [Rubripirellula sp.]